MRLSWGLILLIIPSFGFSQNMKSSSQAVGQAKAGNMQWFSAIPETPGLPPSNSRLQEENRQKIQDQLYAGSLNQSGLGKLASLQLQGSVEEQKQAVLSMLETTVARSNQAFNDLAQWARSQGIRHPQEGQLRQLSQNMEGKTLDERIKMAQNLPAQVKSEVMGSVLEDGLEVMHPRILAKILEQKGLLSPSRYASLLQNGLQNVGHLYDGEQDLPTIEKAIRELQSTPGADLASISCSIWKGLSQYDEPPDRPLPGESNVNTSAAGQKLRGTLMKPLMEMQRNKATCKEVPDIKAQTKALAKQNALSPEDLRALSLLEKGGSASEKNSGYTSAVNCGLKEIQSDLKNQLGDHGTAKIKGPSYFVATTTQNCNIRVITHKKSSGLQAEIHLWNSSGQKLVDLKQDFKDLQELVDFLIKGQYPPPPAPKTLVLTNLPLPPSQPAAGSR